MEEIRLQKYLSTCGILSRRAAEREISRGTVTVNGIPASLGQKIRPGEDLVRLHGKEISPHPVASPGESPPPSHLVPSEPNAGLEPDVRQTAPANGWGGPRRYLMLNKPVGYVTTLSDEKGRPTVRELISDAGARLYPIGRLDQYSSGLLLCTNDGDLTNRLTHPSHHVEKVYLAVINKRLSPEEVETLAEQIELDGYKIQPVQTTIERYTPEGQTVVQFTLWEGRNRQIRRMCAYHGVKLASLTRIRVGQLTLGSLPKGQWRFLTEEEIAYLKTI